MYENKKIDSVKIEKSDYAISRLKERTNDLLKTCYETNTSNFVERRYMRLIVFFIVMKKGIIDNNIIS